MENLKVVILALILLILLIVLGILEKKKNKKNIEKLKVRVNVNGIRGKSTATRLITSILWEAGYHAIGKSTGTAARMMFWDSPEEQEVKRQPRGVSIGEQIKVIDKAVKYGADALVCECMAVRPEYQSTYQHQIIQADLTVIVNVLEDHLDEMGPTTDQIAEAFADTIPYNGAAVIPKDQYTDYFRKVAAERNSKVFVADDAIIPQDLIDKFSYRLFPHNCAVALAAAEALGINRKVAIQGMLKAHPDPGALRIYNLNSSNGEYILVNAFAANEPESSLDIWDTVSAEHPAEAANPVILMNCRPDRVDRTRQFVNDFFPKIPNATLVAIGENTREITKAYNKKRFPNVAEYLNFEKADEEKIFDTIEPKLHGRMLICVGNIHGHGELILDKLLLKGGAPEESTMAYEQNRSRQNAEEFASGNAH